MTVRNQRLRGAAPRLGLVLRLGVVLGVVVVVGLDAGCDNIDVALEVGNNGTPPPTPSGMSVDGRYFRDAGGNTRFLVGYYDDVTFTGLERVNAEQTSFGRIVDGTAGAINYIHMIIDETTWLSQVLPYRMMAQQVDLDTWDPRYWDAVRNDVGKARARNLVVLLSVFDVTLWRYSPWARQHQVRDFFGNLDLNANNTVDEPGEFYRVDDFRNDVGVGKYQRRLIEKTIAEVGWAENVMFSLGVGLEKAPVDWTEAVVAHIKRLRPGPVVQQSDVVPPKVDARRMICCATAAAVHDRVPAATGKGHPVLLDTALYSNALPDAEYTRHGAWYALTSGAAGWGGFQLRAYVSAFQAETSRSLEYSAYLLRFLGALGGELGRMVPDASLVSNPARNAALANPGRAYVAYVAGDEEVALRVNSSVAGRYLLRLYDPRQGTFAPEQRLVDATQPFVLLQRRPLGWDDWVILLVGGF